MFVLAYFVCIKTNLICQSSAYIYCFRVQQVYHSHTGDSVHFFVTFSHYDSGGLIQDLVKRSSENCPPKADPGRPRTRPKGRRTYHPHPPLPISILRRKLTVLFVCHRTVSMTAVSQLKITYNQDKFRAVS